MAQMFSSALGWTHYVILMRIANSTARAFYEIEAAREAWSIRQLEHRSACSCSSGSRTTATPRMASGTRATAARHRRLGAALGGQLQ